MYQQRDYEDYTHSCVKEIRLGICCIEFYSVHNTQILRRLRHESDVWLCTWKWYSFQRKIWKSSWSVIFAACMRQSRRVWEIDAIGCLIRFFESFLLMLNQIPRVEEKAWAVFHTMSERFCLFRVLILRHSNLSFSGFKHLWAISRDSVLPVGWMWRSLTTTEADSTVVGSTSVCRWLFLWEPSHLSWPNHSQLRKWVMSQ